MTFVVNSVILIEKGVQKQEERLVMCSAFFRHSRKKLSSPELQESKSTPSTIMPSAQCSGGVSRRFFSRIFRSRGWNAKNAARKANTNTCESPSSATSPCAATTPTCSSALYKDNLSEPPSQLGRTPSHLELSAEAPKPKNVSAPCIVCQEDAIPDVDCMKDDYLPRSNISASSSLVSLPESFVYVWGDNSRGQILTDVKGAVETPKRVDRLTRHSVASVQCGYMSTWFVSESGDLWAGGCNIKGNISPSDESSEPQINYPKHVEEFEAMYIKSIASSDEHSVIILVSGVPISYGSNEFGQLGHGPDTETLKPVAPGRMLGLTNPVSQVSCGSSHTLILTTLGQVYACGNGGNGCLGMGEEMLDSSPVLKPIPSLVGMPIQQIAAGPEHSMALSLSGKVYSWGRNHYYILGLGSHTGSIVGAPRCVASKGLPPFKHIATGFTHSLAVARKGRLYGCGDNSEGQLGHDPCLKKVFDIFEPLMFEPDFKARLAACGANHSVVVTHKGQLLTFGRGQEGQLGILGKRLAVWKPSYVPFADERNEADSLYFYGIAAGRDHTAAIGVRCSASESLRRLKSGVTVREGLKLSNDTLSGCHSPHVPSAWDTYFRRSSFLTGHNVYSSQKVISHSVDRLPSVVTRVTRHRYAPLSAIQLFQSYKSIDSIVDSQRTANNVAALGDSSICDTTKGLSDKLPGSLYNNGMYTNEETVPAGCSTAEMESRLEAICVTADLNNDVLQALRRRLVSVYSDPHRLNCSFLLPGRSVLLDTEGIDRIYRGIQEFDKPVQDRIYNDLTEAVSSCLDAITPYICFFLEPDQVRCFAIILQSPFLARSSNSVVSLMSRLAECVFKLPYAGRRALVDIFRDQYSAKIFGERVVRNVQLFLNKVIEVGLVEWDYETREPIWHGVVLLQLLYLASTEWVTVQRCQAIDLLGRVRLEGKLAPDFFALESVANVTFLSTELLMMLQHTASRSAMTTFPTQPPRGLLCELMCVYRLLQKDIAVTLPQVEVEKNTPLLQLAERVAEDHWEAEAPSDERCQRCPLFRPEDALTVNTLSSWWTFFLAHWNLCPLEFKRNVIQSETLVCRKRWRLQSEENVNFHLTVRRSHLFDDAWSGILSNKLETVLKHMEVTFQGEEGVDEGGGLTREFFRRITNILFDSKFAKFLYNEETRTVWFNRDELDASPVFFFVGVILGLALYNDILVRLQLPLVVFKKLQEEPVGIDDLVDVYPAEGASLGIIQEWQEDRIEEFNDAFGEMCFEVQYDHFGEMRTAPLKPHGSEIKLTYDTRKEYVDLYVRYLLDTSIRSQFDAFKKGFSRFQTVLIKSLTGRELQLVMCGPPVLDFEDLRKGAEYEGYSEQEEYMQWFWDILLQFNTHMKQKFLLFCTGTDGVPVGGLRELRLKIQKNGREPIDRVPTAFTCFNTLLVPHYGSREKLHRLLVIALEQNQGFGLQ